MINKLIEIVPGWIKITKSQGGTYIQLENKDMMGVINVKEQVEKVFSEEGTA